MRRLFRTFVVTTILSGTMALAITTPATAQVAASITDLGSLGGNSYAYAINDAGQVVGYAATDSTNRTLHAVRWVNGVIEDLGTLCPDPCPVAASSQATDINELGQVVGTSITLDGTTRGFVWQEDTGLRSLRPLDGDIASVVFGINNLGEAVGNSRSSADFGSTRPVMWTADGIPHELDGWSGGSAFDINDRGQVVGQRPAQYGQTTAAFWEAGILTDLNGACTSTSAYAFAINRFGDTAGIATPCDMLTRAVKWVNQSIHDLPTMVPDSSFVQSFDNINDAGDIVAAAPFASSCPYLPTVSRATLWKDGGAIDLGSLATDPCGAISEALAINDHGVVAGSSRLPSGESHAVLFTLSPGLARSPFGGRPRAIPGRIEAADYDVGGPGVAYFDATPGNEAAGGGILYRADDVDIKPAGDDGHAVGWFEAGEWLAYTLDVESEGLYSIQAHVSTVLPGRTFHIEVDGVDVSGPVAVPVVADWEQYQTVTAADVWLPAGKPVLKVVMGAESFMDFKWLEGRR
jgi:probable HAF family extracellular repeat protein